MPIEKNMSNSFTLASENVEAGEALRDFYLTSQRTLNRLMAAQGASFAKTKMMIFIHRQGKVRSTDLVEAFGFAPRTITEAVDAMEKDGLVERVADVTDRRVKHISLTAAGVEVAELSEPIRKRFTDQLFEVLDPAEKKQLAQLIGRLNVRLRELGEEGVEGAESTNSHHNENNDSGCA